MDEAEQATCEKSRGTYSIQPLRLIAPDATTITTITRFWEFSVRRLDDGRYEICGARILQLDDPSQLNR